MTPSTPLRAVFNADWSCSVSVDDKLSKIIRKKYSLIKSKANLEDANRNRIISSGFSLHEDKKYAGSVLIFLSQADGIFEEYISENGNGYFGRAKSGDVKRASSIKNDDILQSIALVKNEIDTRASRSESGFNRNGIMHGLSEFQTYDNEIYSLKSMCLLAFVIWMSNVHGNY